MKMNKLLAIVLCVAMIVTQFTMLGVSAETTYSALSGKDDYFLMGVNMHPVGNYAAYNNKQYSAILDAKNLGSNIIRIDGMPTTAIDYNYYKSVGDIAANNGMQTMLVMNAFANYVRVESEGVFTPYSLDQIDLGAIKTQFTEIATELKGSIKYYQLGNEMDNGFYKGGSSDHGATYNSNYYYDVTATAVALNTAIKAIKAVDTDAQIGVNISYFHTGFIHGLKSVDCDPDTDGTQILALDYIGMDFYSNMIESGLFSSTDYTDVIEDLAEYDEPIIVTEANITATGWNESDNTDVYYEQDADWLAEFVTYCYNSDEVAGFIAYEIYDQSAYAKDSEGNPQFNREAFFGLIDKDGNKKETYTVLQQLYGGTDVARPEITAVSSETVGDRVTGTLVDGVLATDTTLGSTFEAAWFGEAKDLTPVDLTDGELDPFKTSGLIEFDLYVEDAETLKEVAAKSNVTMCVQIFGSDGTNREALNIPLNKIKNDGWNHIALAKNNFYNGNDTAFTCAERIVIRLRANDANSPTKLAISGMKVAVANICGTRLTRKTESTVGTLYSQQLTEYPYASRIGKGDSNNVKELIKFNDSKTIDVSAIHGKDKKGYIEFDFYVEDYEELIHSLTYDSTGTPHSNVAQLNFYITSHNTSSFPNANYQKYDIAAQLTNNGWNHIVLEYKGSDASNVATPIQTSGHNKANVRSYGIRLDNVSAVDMSCKYNMFMMTNVIFTERTVPQDTSVGEVIETLPVSDGTGEHIGNAPSKFSDPIVYKNNFDAAVDFSSSEVEYFEFDLFVSSYGALKKEMAKNGVTNVTLAISASEGYATEPYVRIPNFFSQITKSGWNHIIVPKSDCQSYGGGLNNLDAIKSYGLFFNGTTTGTNATAKVQMGISDIRATGIKKPEMNNIAPNEIAIYDNMNKITVGSDFTTAIAVTLDNAVNAKFGNNEPEYLEFDIFVEDFDKFISATAKNSLQLRISSSIESYDLQSRTAKIGQYITKSGWNHIQIPFAEFEKGSTSGWFDAASINRFRFFFGGTATNSTGAAEEMRIAVANIAATAELIAPDEIMPEHNALVDGIESVTFDGDGLYIIDFSESVKNISADRLLEADVYLNDTTLESLKVMFIDATGEATATYTFTNLVDGWNHLAVRLDDFIYDEGFDKTQIVTCYLISDAGAKIAVANFYTADYVDGDGNRDGVLDIRDLVAMKKHAVGIKLANGMVGNKVAMDVSGNDYIVNAQDLSSLRHYFLNDKWPEN